MWETGSFTIDTKIPWIPKGFTLESHTDMGKLDLSKIKLDIYQSEKQKTGYIEGNDLLKEIKQPLNGAVVKYLYEHQELIPEEWKKYWSVSFFGTVLRSSYGNRSVLCLCWRDRERDWDRRW